MKLIALAIPATLCPASVSYTHLDVYKRQLPYRLDADSAEQAVEKAKEQAENHYQEYEKFEVQAIEIERRSK